MPLAVGSRRRAWVSSAMRRMNSAAARPTPTATASTISNITVSAKQITRMATSLPGALFSVRTKCRASLMFQAMINSSAASAAMGTSASTPASATTASSTTSEWTTPAMGEKAPLRMLVAVRAKAAVAVMPPKKGATMLPSP